MIDLGRPDISAQVIHKWIFAQMFITQQDITMVHINGPKDQAYIKFQDIRHTEDVLKLTRGQVEYRRNTDEIIIANIKAEGMGTGQVRITHLLPEVSDGVLHTVLHRYGEGMEFQSEK